MFTRGLLAIVIGATIATAVFASAATVELGVPKLGAHKKEAATCDKTLTKSWDQAFEPAIGADEVTTVTVSGIDGTACAGDRLRVTLSSSSNAALGPEKTVTIASGDTSKSFDYSAHNIPAADVARVNAIIEP